MYDNDVKAFIKEREDKLGSPLLYRSFATWYAELGRERRDFGVFIYSDGKTLVIEDFFKETRILGYKVESKKEEERLANYKKMEIFIPIDEISSVESVSRSSAEASLKKQTDISKLSSLFNKLLTKNACRVKTKDRTFFLELPSVKEFKKVIEKFKGE